MRVSYEPTELGMIDKLMSMQLRIQVFNVCNGRYANLTELAQAMGISVSQIYRVRQGRRPINEKFIIGSIKAFPGYKLDDLFYVAPEGIPK